jgi:hypothetical protein
MPKTIDHASLLERLDRVKYEKEDQEQDQLEQMSLSSALLALAQINHDREYTLCRQVAEQLLGKVPEPDDADLGDEF